MAEYYWYRTWINEATGTPRTESDLVVVWFDTVAPTDPSAYHLVIIDLDGDGKISDAEWLAATGPSGTKARGDNTNDRLYNPEPSLGKSDGYIYSTEPIPLNSTGLLDDMTATFLPVYPNTLDPYMPCFVRGTWIEVPGGRRRVEDLRAGDLVLTQDGRAVPVRWIGARRLTRELHDRPHLRPIRIAAGALGLGVPFEDLLVSPQHRVLVRSRIAQRMFGQDEVLVPAKHLLGHPGVSVVEDLAEVEYFHILLDTHDIVVSNGAATESLFLGRQFLKTASSAALREIREIFPQLELDEPDFARPVIGSRQGHRLVERHLRNGQAIFTAGAARTR